MQTVVARPCAPLRGLVTSYVGYRYSGLAPGTHLAMPSPSLTVVLGLDGPTSMARMPDLRQPAADLEALVGGLHTRTGLVAHGGAAEGVQLELTPAGARALLGLPAAELGPLVLPLGELLPGADELVARLREEATWPGRFTLLDQVLARAAGRLAAADPRLEHAWRVLTAGSAPVVDVAAAVGWSRRHLSERFAREYGLPPRTAARLARFDRSRCALQASPATRLADLAASCGYADQAHLAREWGEFAGRPPSVWRRQEELPFVQDTRA